MTNKTMTNKAMTNEAVTSKDRAVGRREFLRKMGAGAGLAATAAVPLAGSAQADTENGDEKRKSRYRESDHVKTYYRVNRYPAK
jgi:hypothetical protein